MKYLRFKVKDEIFYGILEGDKVRKITNSYLDKYDITNETFEINDIKFEIPCEPSKIVCIGKNYLDHIKEFDSIQPENPIIFLKPLSSCIAHNETILLPEDSERVDFEAELAIIIGKKCKNINKEDAKDYIFGYSCLNDVTARDIQKSDGQWIRAKGYDTFCPIGPYAVPIENPSYLNIQSELNGKIMQSSNTQNMIFDVYYLVEYISKVMTLLPGDVIATGTPMGVNKLSESDIIKVSIENIGTLTNFVSK